MFFYIMYGILQALFASWISISNNRFGLSNTTDFDVLVNLVRV